MKKNNKQESTTTLEGNEEAQVAEAIESSTEATVGVVEKKESAEEICLGHAKVILNLREKASFDSKILSVLSQGQELRISKNFPNELFYKVSVTVDEIVMNGFCAKEFVSLETKVADGGNSDK